MCRGVGRAVLVLVSGFLASPLAAQFRIERSKSLQRDMEVAAVGPLVSSPEAATGRLWSRSVSHGANVPAVRVHVQVRQARPGGDWRITVRDLAGTEVETVAGDSPQVAAGGFWTLAVKGRGATIELWSDTGAQGIEIAVDQYAFRRVFPIDQAISGLDQRVPIGSAGPTFRALGQPVARLSFMTVEGQFFCTGFLLTPSLMLTNQHCLSTQQEALSAVAEFGLDDFASDPTRVRIQKLEATSEPLDYSVVRLAASPSPAPGVVTLGTAAIVDAQALAILQHPAGEPKQASIEDCVVSGASLAGVGGGASDFGHKCDTLGGSSGSPVMDRQTGSVVGLHHWGFSATSDTPVNQAVHIGLVLDDIKTRAPEVHAELTRGND